MYLPMDSKYIQHSQGHVYEKQVVIIDDQELIRLGLKAAISSFPGFTVAGEAANGVKGLYITRNIRPDILITELKIPCMDGINMLQEIMKDYKDIKIIVITHHLCMHKYQTLIEMGINAILLKGAIIDELEQCLYNLDKEAPYISPKVTRLINEELPANQELINRHPQLRNLSFSEKNILKLIAQNKTSNQIAEILCNSPRTISNHRYRIARKLNLKGGNALLSFVIENKNFFSAICTDKLTGKQVEFS